MFYCHRSDLVTKATHYSQRGNTFKISTGKYSKIIDPICHLDSAGTEDCFDEYRIGDGTMRTLTKLSLGLIAAFAYSTALVQPVLAHDLDLVVQAKGGKPGKPPKDSNDSEESGDGGGSTRTPIYYDWMHSDVLGAWNLGAGNEYLGQGVTITVVDDFSSRSKFFGNLGDGLSRSRHGEWTLKQAGMIAPSANMIADDFNSGDWVSLVPEVFNVINLSYGMIGTYGYGEINWGPQESSIITHAAGGAFISKAAGNDEVGVGEPFGGLLDYLARDLIGTDSTIFVGALDGNGTIVDGMGTGTLAWYSNTAGFAVNQYLVVGVDGDLTGLYGTSFAAPIISGYAAVLSNKFLDPLPKIVASRLLTTARTDTILGYNIAIHGQGEASISLALAPDYIN